MMLSLQEIFDISSKHLLTQGKQSVSDYSDEYCMYRNHEGLKCAVGCLISDEAYNSRMENSRVGCKVVNDALTESNIDIHNTYIISLLLRLQGLHDSGNAARSWTDTMVSGLAKIAKSYKLKFTAPIPSVNATDPLLEAK